jgi:hypothetical protein
MPIETIRYLTTTERIEQALTRSQHPTLRLLYTSFLEQMAADKTEEQQAVAVTGAISEVVSALCTLSHDLTCHKRQPVLPADPAEQARMWHEGCAELVHCLGYQDITERVRHFYAEDAQAAGKPSLFDYQYVLESPHSVYYVRTLSDLLIVLDEARQAAHTHDA